MSPLRRIAHALTLVLLLVGWSQQLCAEVGMACGDEEPVATEAPSCHAEPEAPTVPEPAAEMSCCALPDAVLAAPMTSAEELDEPASFRRHEASRVEATETLRRPAPPPPRTARFEELCALLI
ncbi:MAG: hypothetical protein AAGA81_19005 [Acidobacteriota bacterium]